MGTKNDLVEGFTKKYGVHTLVWFEMHSDIHTAIAREKRLKRWNRAWKIKLIEENNSGWNDIYDRLLGKIALPDMPGVPNPYTHLSSPASANKVRAREGDPGGETIAVLKE
ncbi:MAG TPA: GIY-YIG nuclease family protein [Rhizomicrobium sp.]|jgi:hypothetical protein|nr:GIY-YIG nuclease family protein [Rhizomicrobium sp.]